ncbi:MAG TPA: MFS transporter [Solirubrobacteraceae bacterium]|jgi:DHA2 family multidrug resistance protein-like MFS transporter|nr:MFS transporter [Solirubrobacteraceae bacterium]
MGEHVEQASFASGSPALQQPAIRPSGEAADRSTAPQHPRAVLAALIAVAAVANLNLAVANVALPDIGKAFDASQTGLDLIAVGFSLGLAASVLYLGALGDRYGRKLMLMLGTTLAIPAALLAAFAPSITVLFFARLMGGLAAGMAFPTTLALITALWSGPARTRSIALWSGLGGAISALGPLLAGALLTQFHWGSVFFITLPLAFIALYGAWRYVPAHVNETTGPVDNLGGVLSVIGIAALILAINFAPVPGEKTIILATSIVALIAGAAFVLRQRRAQAPLYDLKVASRKVFWVAALAGIIVFGSLVGAMFIGQQFLQDVLGYSTLDAGLSILPAAVFMVLIAPRSAKLVDAKGARFTLLVGYGFCMLGFLTMLLLWKQGIAYWKVGLGYAFIGAGVGFACTPASHSLTGSVPVSRAGMASGTADLQRDLGGAIMQSIFGALLTAGYAAAVATAIASSPEKARVTTSVEGELEKSFSSAADTASRYPQYAKAIAAGARESFVKGDQWAYTAGIVAIALGAVLVFFMFPRKAREEELLAEYHTLDTASAAAD